MKNNELSVLFCGDFAPCRRWLNAEISVNIFGNLQPVIKDADLSFVNLETPATNIGKAILKDGPNLRTIPEWLVPLKKVGFKLIGLANNHMGDFGPESVLDCIENCKNNNLATVGAGKNIFEAKKIFYFTKNGITVAIIAVCEQEFGLAKENVAGTAPLDIIENVRQIHEAKQNADFVFITIHGGNEYFPYPRPNMRKQCLFYIEQGCDAIICHHPHIAGGYEVYNDKPIFYSLGNFLFDTEKKSIGWNDGYVVKLVLNSSKHSIEFEILPYTQSFDQNGLVLLQKLEKVEYLKRLDSYRNTILNDEEYIHKWVEFCIKKRDNYFFIHYLPCIIKGLFRILKLMNFSNFVFKNSKNLVKRLNFVRNDSHRDAFICILEEELKKKEAMN